jgi:hypothetical protein
MGQLDSLQCIQHRSTFIKKNRKKMNKSLIAFVLIKVDKCNREKNPNEYINITP